MATGPQPAFRLTRFRKILLAIAVTLALLLGLAAWQVPRLVRGALTQDVAELLGRPVSVGDIRFNPFSLTLRIDELAVAQPDAPPLLSIAQAEASVSWKSLFWLAPVVDYVTIREPRLMLKREDALRFNFTDIQEKLAAMPAGPEPEAPAGMPRFAFSNLVLENGAVTLDDTLTGRRHVIDEIGLGVPFISSFGYAATIEVEPYLRMRVNGSPFQADGVALPFDAVPSSVLNLSLDGLELEKFADAWPAPLPVKLEKARLDSRLRIVFEQPAGAAARLRVDGGLSVSELDLREAAGAPLARWDALRVQELALEPFAQTLEIGKVSLDGLQAHGRRDAQGRLNWQAIAQAISAGSDGDRNTAPAPADTAPASSTPSDAAGPTAATASDTSEAPDAQANPADAAMPPDAWRVAVHAITMDGAGLQWQDAALPLDYALSGLSASLEPLRWPQPADQPARFRLTRPAAEGPGLDVQGSLHLAPFALSADARLDGLSLTPFAQAVRKQSPVRVESGVLSLSGQVQAREAQGGIQAEVRQARAGLAQLAVRDESVSPAVPLRIEKLDVGAERLALDSTPTAFTVDAAGINGAGRLALKGELTPQPLSVKTSVDLAGLELSPYAAYAAGSLNATVRSVAVNARGQASFAPAEGKSPMKAQWQGGVDVTGLHLIDRINKADFLSWKKLALANMRVSVEGDKFAAHLGDVTLDDFYGRILLNAEGRLNVMDLVAEPGKAGGSITQDTQTQGRAAPAAAQAGPPPDVSIASVKLANGRMTFTDRFVKPNYTAELSHLAGSLSAISARKPEPAKVNVTGRVYSTAPLSVSGTVQPFSDFLSLDLRVSAKGVDLPRFTTYSAKYVGYPIQRGKLSMDLEYRIKNRALQASNHVVLNQLTFGDKTDSPDAIQLPVLLAVALLKDSKGDIDINLPVSGSLDDPEFSIGGIILRVLGNLLVKAVTSPFTLLASAFGGGEELSYIDFDSGSSALSTEAQSRLETLSKALNDRPGLKLDIAGRADPAADEGGLRHAWLERQLRLAKARAASGKPDPAGITVSAAERGELLEKVYKNTDIKDKPRNAIGFAKSAPPEEMEALLLSAAPVDAEELRKLADARAQAVYERLVESVPVERVFIVAPVLDGSGNSPEGAPPSRVDFALK